MKKYILLVAGLLSMAAAHAQSGMRSLYSPDKSVKIVVGLTPKTGEPFYATYYNGKPVSSGRLGFQAKDADFSKNFQWKKTLTGSGDQTWKPVWGEVSAIRDNYKELTMYLENASGKMNIRFRAYNNGIGFRYEFPAQQRKEIAMTDEITQFEMPGDHTAWWIPGDWDSNEHVYTTSKISAIDTKPYEKENAISTKHIVQQYAVQTPITMRTADGTHISIAEAALVDFAALHLLADPKALTFKANLIPSADPDVKSINKTPFHSPWRAILMSKDAAGILDSKLILNLNEPCKIKGDLSWIKPQKYVGIWWEMHVNKSTWDYAGSQSAVSFQDNLKPSGKHGATTANTKKYIDFAAKHGFDGVLVEGWNVGWENWFGKWKDEVFDFTKPYPDYDIDELSRYAKEKGVKIIMHHETSAAVPSYERQMDNAYAYMKKYGMNSVKTGYVGRIIPKGEWHDGQWMVNHYVRVAERTAKNKIMLDAHEPVRPSGLQRTWPNWLACEAARGQEFNAWSAGNPPEHETILPFTRLLGGPMDYTPGIFQIHVNQFDPNKKEQVHTTVAKQLALYVTLYSPLQMAADLPENYEKRLDVFEFIKDVPVDWSDTRIINAEIGDYMTVARREKGSQNWFVGSISDENARDFTVKLDFLSTGKSYEATIYEDGPGADWKKDPYPVNIRKVTVKKGDTLNLKLAPGGGCAISLLTK